MLDAFTGQPTRIRGRAALGPEDRAALQHDHERRLEAVARVRACAAECGVATDPDRDLVTIPEDAVALLELSDPRWAKLGAAIRELRTLLPLRRLDDFGFMAETETENPLEEPNLRLRRIGGGVEAWAFAAESDGSVYKFYLPIAGEAKRVGSVFAFQRGEESMLHAEAHTGDYCGLLEKLLLIQALGGMATEVVAITPEGIVVAKQTLGEPLPQGDDVSALLPRGLIEIPSRFLRANRDHPRLFFLGGRAWLVADLHARNFVRGADGALHVIDLVAAPWPLRHAAHDALINDWLARVRENPAASALPAARDDEL